jgi:hypothetical protein
MEIDRYKSFDKSLVKSLSDVNIDMSEGILDSLIDSDILDTIPIVKILKAGVVFGNSLKEKFFFKKLVRFLFEIQTVPEKERSKFILELEKSEQRKKVYDNTLLVIDRLDEETKASIIGKLFCKLVEGIVERDEYFRLVNLVEKVFIADLELIKYKAEAYRATERPMEVLRELDNEFFKETMANFGIYKRYYKNKDKYKSRNGETTIKTDYGLTTLGKLLVDNGF